MNLFLVGYICTSIKTNYLEDFLEPVFCIIFFLDIGCFDCIWNIGCGASLLFNIFVAITFPLPVTSSGPILAYTSFVNKRALVDSHW
jgi:hypothetical protein